MTQEEIIKTVNQFLVEEFEVEESKITPDANLRETLELDSLDYVDLVVVIESNFGFKVVGEDFVNIHTFQDFYNYCYKKVQEKTTA
jgi:acyl carrier protein